MTKLKTMDFIWKYHLMPGYNELEVPQSATPLHVDTQMGQVTVWLQVNDREVSSTQHYYVAWTGKPLPEECTPENYIGTAFTGGGVIVNHVYHIKEQS